MRVRHQWLGILALLLGGCASSPNPPAPERLPQAITGSGSERTADPQLREATAKAQNTLASFIKRLSAPNRGETFSVEGQFSAEDNSPVYLWLSDVVFKDGKFSGTVSTHPKKATKLRFGDQAELAEKDVTDWMILKSGRTEGGFTIEVLLKREGAAR